MAPDRSTPDAAPEPSGVRRSVRVSRLHAAMGACLAICLVVPESEIHAKLFKTGVIIANLKRMAI